MVPLPIRFADREDKTTAFGWRYYISRTQGLALGLGLAQSHTQL
jgi:hypothetical protein